MRIIIRYSMIVFTTVCLFATSAESATLTAPNCTEVEVQKKINEAASGDIVAIPAGNCTWTNGVSWNDKNLTLKGAGQGVTVITTSADPMIRVTADSRASFRITGMTINWGFLNHSTIYLVNNTITPRKGWRIDHITFNQTGGGTGGASHPIVVIGLLWGVVDNCVFNDNGNGQQSVSHYAYVNQAETESNVGRISWENIPAGLGTDTAVYVENCIFNHSTTNMSAVNDTEYGGRMVIRYSTIYNSMVMTHSGRGDGRGGLKLEIYNNTFTSNVGYFRPALIRSGTGVFFNNNISGNYEAKVFSIDNQRSCLAMPTLCDGTDQKYDKNTPGERGWPCEDQPGTGGGAWRNQILEPWYAWNNGIYEFVNNSACPSPQVKSGRDYFNNGGTPKPGYTAYTYPHPLTERLIVTEVDPPTNVRIVEIVP